MLPLHTLLAIAAFAFVTSITPGPNNLMLLASGVNHGVRATLPHMAGITGGFLSLLLAVGLGLAALFSRQPMLFVAMKWLGVGYLLFLAWGIARSGVPDTAPDRARLGKPLGFWGAAAFQWVNPKAWVMAVSVFSSYVGPAPSAGVVLEVSLLFAAINLPSVGAWAVFGALLQQRLRRPRVRCVFNLTMAALLVASLGPLLRELLLATALPELLR